MFKQAEQDNPLPTKSNWTVVKANHDVLCIRKYLIPFIRKSGANWSEINDRFADSLVEYMRNGNLSDTTIQRYKGSFNLLFRKAISYVKNSRSRKFAQVTKQYYFHSVSKSSLLVQVLNGCEPSGRC